MKKFTAFCVAGFLAISAGAQVSLQGITNNMVSGDFDSDGFVDDIVALNAGANQAELLLWNSNGMDYTNSKGNFIIPEDLISAKSLSGKVVSGDFDNDGFRDDIAAIYEVGFNKTSVTVWINNNGVYTPERWWYGGDFDANQVTSSLVSGDFDNDGFIDDIAALYDYGDELHTKIFVWKSNGKQFGWPGTWWVGSDFNTAQAKGKIVSGDFDHDGFCDDIAALYDYYDNRCKLFMFTGESGAFQWPQIWFSADDFSIERAENKMVSGDFNHNGYNDNIAAVYHENGYTQMLVWEKGENGFNKPSSWWYGQSEGALVDGRVVAIDADNDGRTDEVSAIALSNDNANALTWKSENDQFNLPLVNWGSLALSNQPCNEQCINNDAVDVLSVYPNPGNGVVTLNAQNLGASASVKIFNSLGQLVYQNQALVFNSTNDFSSLGKGSYVILAENEGITLRSNLIIQ